MRIRWKFIHDIYLYGSHLCGTYEGATVNGGADNDDFGGDNMNWFLFLATHLLYFNTKQKRDKAIHYIREYIQTKLFVFVLFFYFLSFRQFFFFISFGWMVVDPFSSSSPSLLWLPLSLLYYCWLLEHFICAFVCHPNCVLVCFVIIRYANFGRVEMLIIAN